MCPAEALFEVLVITSEHCEIVHDVLYAGHCLHRELAHAVMVLGEWQLDVAGGENTLTNIKPCVGPLQPETG